MTKNLIEAYKRHYFSSAIADVYRAIRGECFDGSFTLLFCIIDSLSWIQFGRKKNSFNEWIERWLQPYNIRYGARAEYLYAARCSWIHAYGVSERQENLKISISFRLNKYGSHIDQINNVFFINLPDLLVDVSFGAYDFFTWVKNERYDDKEVLQRIAKLSKPFLTQSVFNRKQFLLLADYPYKKMDKCLSIFDKPEKLPDDIRLLKPQDVHHLKLDLMMYRVQRIPSLFKRLV